MPRKQSLELDSFVKLQAEWAEKLQDEGFQDLEASERHGIIRPQVFNPHRIEGGGGEAYSDYCELILREFTFKRDIDKAIFEKHSEGHSERWIEIWLKEHSYKSLTQQRINQIIKKIKNEFENSQ